MRFLLLALVLLASGPVRPAPRPEARDASGNDLLREAKAFRYQQQWFQAAAAYRSFLTANPESARVPEARFWLAASLESDQRWDEASQAYTRFLALHPDQRLLGKEAKLNRIRCWGMRQGQEPGATPGLLEALKDDAVAVQVAAALQLAKVRDARAVEGLRKGLALPACADACSLDLIAMGVKPGPAPRAQARFLVIRIKESGRKEAVTIRLPLALARAMENYLSDAQLRQARQKGFDLEGITEQAATLPKGSVLLAVEDGKSDVQVTVE